MARDTKPNEIIVDRAITIWKRALSAPKYQIVAQGERRFQDDKSEMLANILPHMIPKNNTSEILTEFGRSLKVIVMAGKVLESGNTYYDPFLSVDYHPCERLAVAAKESGLNMEFPYKTDMYIGEDHLTWSYGYGAPRQYHYPLADGRWLVTRLYGEDINKVIEYVMGEKPEFVVED